MKLEEKLVSLRKGKGLSQLKLAEIVNVSRQAVSRWESGLAVPSTENLKLLGELYHISVDVLLTEGKELPAEVDVLSLGLSEGKATVQDKITLIHRKFIRRVLIAAFILSVIVVMVLFYGSISSNETKGTSIDELESEVWDNVDSDEFSLDW